jgi:hypothetical protein
MTCCESTASVFSKSSIGLLEEPELGQVEEHLLVCETCRTRLTELDDTWGLNG